MVVFFDEYHARFVGIETVGLECLFFILLTASTVGATAWLLTDHFPCLLMVSVPMGAYSSYFLDGVTGGFRCKPSSFYWHSFWRRDTAYCYPVNVLAPS